METRASQATGQGGQHATWRPKETLWSPSTHVLAGSVGRSLGFQEGCARLLSETGPPAVHTVHQQRAPKVTATIFWMGRWDWIQVPASLRPFRLLHVHPALLHTLTHAVPLTFLAVPIRPCPSLPSKPSSNGAWCTAHLNSTPTESLLGFQLLHISWAPVSSLYIRRTTHNC